MCGAAAAWYNQGMTNQAATIIAFPFQLKEPGTPLTDSQMFWEWKMKTISYLNDCAERGIEPHDEVKASIREVNGYMIELGYPPLDVGS